MFRVTGKAPFFEEVPGPWMREYFAVCAVAADINKDGLDE